MTAEPLTTERPYLFENDDEPGDDLRRLSGTAAHGWTIQTTTDEAFSYDADVLLPTRDGRQLTRVARRGSRIVIVCLGERQGIGYPRRRRLGLGCNR